MKFLSKSKKVASLSKERFKHGALVIKGGSVLASGYNHGKVHAEIHALSRLWGNKIRGCTLISIRITKTGFGNSYPCSLCQANMLRNRVKSFIYFNGKEWLKERV